MVETKFGRLNDRTGRLDLWGETDDLLFRLILAEKDWSKSDRRRFAVINDQALRKDLEKALATADITIVADWADVDGDGRAVDILDCDCGMSTRDCRQRRHNLLMQATDVFPPLPHPSFDYSLEEIGNLARTAIDAPSLWEDYVSWFRELENQLADPATTAALLGYCLKFAYGDKTAVTYTGQEITVHHTTSLDDFDRLIAEFNRVVDHLGSQTAGR